MRSIKIIITSYNIDIIEIVVIFFSEMNSIAWTFDVEHTARMKRHKGSLSPAKNNFSSLGKQIFLYM